MEDITQFLKQEKTLQKLLSVEIKEMDKFIKKNFGTIGKKILYGTVTLADLVKHRAFLERQLDEFKKEKIKERLESLGVK
jgi:hypothetical protein